MHGRLSPRPLLPSLLASSRLFYVLLFASLSMLVMGMLSSVLNGYRPRSTTPVAYITINNNKLKASGSGSVLASLTTCFDRRDSR